MKDLIERQAALDALKGQLSGWNDYYNIPVRKSIVNIERLPSAQSWIPVIERLPEELQAVNITYINHDINDYTAVSTGVYFHRKWYWETTLSIDYLKDFGECNEAMVDDAIEIIAWMPRPEPYKKELQ